MPARAQLWRRTSGSRPKENARIAAGVVLTGARLEHPSGPGGAALRLSGARVTGDVICSGLTATGGLRATGARIGGKLDLSEATLAGPDGAAAGAAGPAARLGEHVLAVAGAEIGDGPLRVCGNEGKRLFHQGFGIRPRDQGGGCDAQIQRPELAPAGEVGHRLAVGAAGDQVAVGRRLAGIQLPLRPGPQVGAIAAQQVAQQDLGIESGAVCVGVGQVGDGFGQQLPQGEGAVHGTAGRSRGAHCGQP